MLTRDELLDEIGQIYEEVKLEEQWIYENYSGAEREIETFNLWETYADIVEIK